MVRLNINDKIKIKILKQYKKKNIDYTASYLSEILGHKYQTIKKALEFFFELGICKKDIKEHGKKNYVYYGLNEIGQELLKSEKL